MICSRITNEEIRETYSICSFCAASFFKVIDSDASDVVAIGRLETMAYLTPKPNRLVESFLPYRLSRVQSQVSEVRR